jgi:aryl-alcohol dehydrogenase-like predicted oxidoreductase
VASVSPFTIGGDLTVNRLGFGTMRLTGRGVWGEPANRTEALAVLRRAVALGMNLIDTADAYGPNVAEELVAEALHPYPKGVVIATKAGFTRAERRRATPAQVAIAWLLQKSPVMLPIPGTSTVAHLEENAGGGTLVLDDETVEALDRQAATPR